MKVPKLILSIVFGLIFINAGLDKFFHYMPVPPLSKEMQKLGAAFMTISWILPLVGFIEITGGLLFSIPKTRALGAILILPIMVGILLHNSLYAPEGLIFAGILFLINLWILYENRNKYKLLIN